MQKGVQGNVLDFVKRINAYVPNAAVIKFYKKISIMKFEIELNNLK